MELMTRTQGEREEEIEVITHEREEEREGTAGEVDEEREPDLKEADEEMENEAKANIEDSEEESKRRAEQSIKGDERESTEDSRSMGEKWETIDEILNLMRDTVKAMDTFNLPQLDGIIKDMGDVIAFEKRQDHPGQRWGERDYGVETQQRIFKLAESEALMHRVKLQRDEMKDRKKQEKRKRHPFRRSWHKLRKMLRFLRSKLRV